MPDAMTSSIALLRLPQDPDLPPPLRGRFVVHLRVAYNGPAAEGQQIVEPLRQAAPVAIDTVAEMPFSAAGSIHNDPPGPIPFWDTSTLVTELSADAVFLVYACSIVPPELAAAAVAEHTALESALGPWKTGHVLLNFTSSDSPERVATAFSAQTHVRLLELKARYDPHNLFRFAGLTR
ncbi:BBE domain-containing protein [Saccharopolyspora sp. K220]|uniref:BBE domain-containing protein n=1 Tax=Saccharopolyspora soli TaxID=2926618 RepID=UPI001F5A3C4A|nr:BBE domain-containing protein [Saccharopolyspora soli]MCI2423780.1 BBE domain-containing protein [Saccharopolyspora soli]